MQISYDQVSNYSDLPKKIALANSTKGPRSLRDVEREFELESWSEMLKIHESNPLLSLEEVESLFIRGQEEDVYFYQNCFFVDKRINARRIYKDLLAKKVVEDINPLKAILELGAGYGAILNQICMNNATERLNLIGAELSVSGQKLIESVCSAGSSNIVSRYFNFLDPKLSNDFNGNLSVVFTSYALMYVEDIGPQLIDFLIELNADRYIFAEPIYQDVGTLIQGKLARKYMEMNGYNLSLLPSLVQGFENFSDFRLQVHLRNVFGANPFLPCSILVFFKNKTGNS